MNVLSFFGNVYRSFLIIVMSRYGSKILSSNNFIQGSCLCVTTVCEKNHTFQWYSQKKIKKKAIGNICIGFALMLSGILFAQMVKFCQVLKLHFFSRSSYDKIIKYYIVPVVYDVWTYHKQDNINNLKTLSNIWLAG